MLKKQFGQAPRGERLDKIRQSPSYNTRLKAFENIHYTPTLASGYSMWKVLYNFFIKKHPRIKPHDPVPAVKNNLQQLALSSDLLVWFGHSSYFLQLNGRRFLVDPVFSGNASPIPGSNKSFQGTDIYTAADMPPIDYLLITHDHYDHLDYQTILQLKPKIKHIICGLGVGQHFEYWGFNVDIITELDRQQQIPLSHHMQLYTAPTRHFSRRGLKRNNTLWLSFVLETPDVRIYLGGDSGYDTHFKELGQKFGGFDLALLDNGQYNEAWQAIHMLPWETLQAARDLKTKRLMPVHSSKFKLSVHPWDEPLKKITALNEAGSAPMAVITPRIGELVYLDNPDQVFSRWWEGVQ